MTHHRPALAPRLTADTLLGTRQTAAVLVHRHPDQVRRRCHPVACDALSRLPLYDLDQVAAAFRAVPRRARDTADFDGSLTSGRGLVHPMPQ